MTVTRDCVRRAAILHRMMASLAILFMMLLLVAPVFADGHPLTDDQVRKALVENQSHRIPEALSLPV